MDLGSNKTLCKRSTLKDQGAVHIESENGSLEIEIEKLVAMDVSF